MWSHDVVSTSINLASDLKMGQYLKIPPRVMFLTQVWGTLLGETSLVYLTMQLITECIYISGAVINYGKFFPLLASSLHLLTVLQWLWFLWWTHNAKFY